MKTRVKIGIAILAAVWVALCVGVILSAGFTLYNLLICVISGVIVFVPLYKKYYKNGK